MNIQILIYDGFDELDAIAPFEVLQSARKAGGDLRTTLVTLDGSQEVVAQNGLQVKAMGKLDDEADIVLIPGGGWVARSEQGAWTEAQRGTIPAAIKEIYDAGKVIAAVCTGAMLVATAGLLKGRDAITHHNATNELRETGANVVDARVVDDNDIITAGLDLALWLVERYCGSHVAIKVEQNLEYQRRGAIWRNA